MQWNLWTALASAVCALLVATADGPRAMGLYRAWDLSRLPLVLVLAFVAGVHLVLFQRYGPRAVMPLPVPTADPLATYREGAAP